MAAPELQGSHPVCRITFSHTFSNLRSLHTKGRLTNPPESVSAITLFFGATLVCRKDASYGVLLDLEREVAARSSTCRQMPGELYGSVSEVSYVSRERVLSLRTTNNIERLNKEFKRRTKPMEIVAGENACYTLLAFICLKMELHCKSNSIGKVRKDLPFFKELVELNFTQKT